MVVISRLFEIYDRTLACDNNNNQITGLTMRRCWVMGHPRDTSRLIMTMNPMIAPQVAKVPLPSA